MLSFELMEQWMCWIENIHNLTEREEGKRRRREGRLREEAGEVERRDKKGEEQT